MSLWTVKDARELNPGTQLLLPKESWGILSLGNNVSKEDGRDGVSVGHRSIEKVVEGLKFSGSR